MANENKRLSEAGWAALRQREQAVMHYYNDQANNCTFGVGTLAHTGACTPEELRRPVTPAQVNAQLAARVSTAEAQVRRNVTQRELTQAQFDELVSYTYNAGNTGALSALHSANQNNAAAFRACIQRRSKCPGRRAPIRGNRFRRRIPRRDDSPRRDGGPRCLTLRPVLVSAHRNAPDMSMTIDQGQKVITN